MRLDTFVWAAILDSSHPYIGSAVALPDTLTLHVEYKYVYIHTYSVVNVPSVVNTGSGVSVSVRQ